MRRLLINISGARPEILDQCPTERVRFLGLGWAMLVASGLAAVSMWDALTSIIGINGIFAVPAATAWGLVILGVGRWIVASVSARGFPRWAQLLPRLLVTLILAVLVAAPLVLRVFQAEINLEIVSLNERQVAAFVRETQQSAIGQQIRLQRAQVDRLNAIITRGPGKPGYMQAVSQLPAAQKQLQIAENRQNVLINQFTEANAANTGVVLRLQALSQAEAGNVTLSASVFLLVTLFLVVEALPMTMRQLQRPGIYEQILLEVERRELLDARRSMLGTPSAMQRPRLAYSGRTPTDSRLFAIWGRATQHSDIDRATDHRDFDLSSIWSSAAERRHVDGVTNRRDATEPELEPAESYEHTRYEDAALAMLEDSRSNDWPTPPDGIPLRWDDEDI